MSDTTVVIGGLIRDDIEKVVNKVPFFGDLPIIGGLFRSQKDVIQKKREAKQAGSIYVEDAPKFFLVIRTKGLNRIEPKAKKILRLFRLLQINNAVFVRNTKATMNMMRVIEPWITYGSPSRRTVHHLIYKRGFGKIDGRRIPFTTNEVIEKGLGEHGIKCVEDLLHEIYTVGPHFKQANNFLCRTHRIINI